MAVVFYDKSYGESETCQFEAMKIEDMKVPILCVDVTETDENDESTIFEPSGWLFDFVDMALGEEGCILTASLDNYDDDVDKIVDEIDEILNIIDEDTNEINNFTLRPSSH